MRNEATPAVETDRLSRWFDGRRRGRTRPPKRVALDGVSLRVAASSVHGLLGPNGAGKTTLVKILSTILLPTSGTARVMGHDVVREPTRVRPLVGIVLGGDRGLYSRLTARQNLRYWGSLYGLPRVEARRRSEALLDTVGLLERADDRVETYSRGMKQRLHLARGLVGDPAVLYLDEPTSGLDPVGAREFREMVRGLRRTGRTVMLATHDMAEAEALCDEVTFLDHGAVLASERPEALRSRLQMPSLDEVYLHVVGDRGLLL
jgi:ABC-2 type transport system ATP-binding protein